LQRRKENSIAGDGCAADCPGLRPKGNQFFDFEFPLRPWRPWREKILPQAGIVPRGGAQNKSLAKNAKDAKEIQNQNDLSVPSPATGARHMSEGQSLRPKGNQCFDFDFPLRLCAFARERFLPMCPALPQGDAKTKSLAKAQRRKGKSKG
jgi:hypothetical protein